MKRLLFFIACLLGLLVFSQPSDSTKQVIEDANKLYEEEKYDDVLKLIRPAVYSAKETKNWPVFSECAGIEAKTLRKKKDYQQGVKALDEALSVLAKAGQSQTVHSADLWVWKALHYRMLQDYSATLESYQTAIKIYEKQDPQNSNLPLSYKNAAQIFQRRSNNALAIKYLKAALPSDTAREYHTSIYYNLANSYLFLDSLEVAKRYVALAEKDTSNKDAYMVASLNATNAEIALLEERLDEARQYQLSALQYYQDVPTEGDNRIRSYAMLADIAARQNNPREAEQYFQKADAEGKSFYKGKSREMAKLYIETGFFYEKTGRPEHALAFYQKALVQSFPNFNSLNISENPSIEDAWLESQAMRAAAAKALILAKNTDAASRHNAAHCFDLSFAVATQLRRTYGDDADKFALAANNRQSYNAAALNLWQLWRENNDPLILARLFAFLEQTKAQALGDALQQQRALALTGIPDSLLAREENLRLEIAGFVGDLKKRQEVGDSAGIVAVKERIFKQEKAYNDFLEALKTQFSQFRQFTQAGLTADLSVIQASLPGTTALLSWFDAGDRYLCVVMRRHHLTAFEVSRDSLLDGKLSGFFNTLSDKNSQQSNPDAYFSDAHFLFKKLLPDASLSSIQSLIIIPDGSLCYLPFEALLTAEHKGDFANAPYLIRLKTVQYAWAATLLTLSPLKNDVEKGLLQIAPFSQSARDGLAILANSTHDIPGSIANSVLNGTDATTDEFLKKAPRHSVIHLSTHADAGGSGTPGIELYDRRLTLPEIYAQRFHASLVSLSACETGKGRFAKGEGVLSLARAFAYAGAQSLVASHWSVNERSTAELFSDFYKNLEKGLPKAEALRQAKLSYLSSSELDARKAPFHWAAFTLTGADGSVDFGGNHLKKWLLGIAGLVVLAFLFRRFYFFKTGKTTPEL